ncbi:hypothetical protein [Lysobacter sp. N42]|uniref:hypothetical protein n=1 Tax=Lysobacter sp. N42 TaxID=2545719 RepID=UPI001FB6DBDF|nr:hypothetical protein [Lysobacter sp. N42]
MLSTVRRAVTSMRSKRRSSCASSVSLSCAIAVEAMPVIAAVTAIAQSERLNAVVFIGEFP